jgi:hypothetical protein
VNRRALEGLRCDSPQKGSANGYGLPIGCLVVLFAFISPRLALFALWLFSDLLSRAFESWFVPFLGFFLLPWTTLAYAAMWDSSNRVSGFEWFVVILAFLIDLGSYASRGRFAPRQLIQGRKRPFRRDRPGRRSGCGAWQGRQMAARSPCRRPAR